MPEPTVIEQPSQMTQLASQLKEQNDKALGLTTQGQSDDMKRLEEEFAKAGIQNTPVIPSAAPVAPAAAPAAGAKEGDTKDDKPADQPATPKSRVPASLLTKKTEAKTEKTDAKVEGDDFTPPAGLTPKSNERFQELANRAKASEQWRKDHEPKLKEYEAELTKLRATPPPAVDKEAFEQLKKERDEFDATLKRLSIEHHPQFKAAFDDKIASHLAKGKEIVGKDYAATLESIVSAPADSKEAAEAYEKLVEEVGPFKANQLLMLKTRIDELKGERAHELENWKKNHTAAEQVERMKAVEAEKARVAERDMSIRKTLADITSEQSDLYVFRKVEGDNDWNAGVDKRLAEFQQFATRELTPSDQVELAKRAAAAAGAFDLIERLNADYQQVLAELNGIKKATPGFGGGSPSGGGSREPENETYQDRVTRLASEAGVFNR